MIAGAGIAFMAAAPMLMMGGMALAGGFSGYGAEMYGASDGILGPRRGGLIGGLLGGLIGGVLTMNPIGALVGGALGALLGGLFGGRQAARCQYPPQAGYYPPPPSAGFGGPGWGGYGVPPYGYRPPVQGNFWFRGHVGFHHGCCPPHRCCPCWRGRNLGGFLRQQRPGAPIEYTTSGGFRVTINGHNVTITDPSGKTRVVHSGDPHEYVNGRHIKDWNGKQRSILLPDGTKITMSATGPHGVITHTSIYDGDQNIQINNNGNRITHRSFDPWDTRTREYWQYDGETAAIVPNWGGGMDYVDVYNQDSHLGVHPLFRELAHVPGRRFPILYAA